MLDKLSKKVLILATFVCLWITITSFLFVINSRFFYTTAMRYAENEMTHRVNTITLFTKVLAGDERLEKLVVPYVKSLDANIRMEVENKDGKVIWQYEQAPSANKTFEPVKKTYKRNLYKSDDILMITYTKYIRPPMRTALLKAWAFSYRNYIGDKDRFQEHKLIGRDGPLLTYALLVALILGGLFIGYRPAVEKIAAELAQIRLNRDKTNPIVIRNLIDQGESATLEFKQTLQFNTYKKNLDKEMIRMSMKTIAAFLNTDGGTLLIGVKDDGSVTGLADDLKFFKNGLDGFELKLHDLITDQIKPSPTEKIEICFLGIEDQSICRIDVKSSRGKGVFHLNNDVYIRQGNRTKQLEGINLTEWVMHRKH